MFRGILLKSYHQRIYGTGRFTSRTDNKHPFHWQYGSPRKRFTFTDAFKYKLYYFLIKKVKYFFSSHKSDRNTALEPLIFDMRYVKIQYLLVLAIYIDTDTEDARSAPFTMN